MAKYKVLLIGSGRRVQKGILPALWCLRDRFEIASIYSRTIKEPNLFSSQFQLTTINDLARVDFSEIQLIIVAITTENVPDVLRSLSKFNTQHIVLFLDTPVLPSKGLGVTRHFKNFKQVRVTEDMIALPPYVAARRLIEEGKIGKLQSIDFYHSGYKYHALAALKYLSGQSYIQSMHHQRLPDGKFLKKIKLPGGIRAEIWEPRDYSKGRLLIVGDKGRIADYTASENNYVISYKVEDNTYRGLKINKQEVPLNELDLLYLDNIPADRLEKDMMNSLKIRALMDLFNSAIAGPKENDYPPIAGLYDMLAIKISEKFGWFLDLPIGKKSIFQTIIKLFSRII